MYFWNSCFLDSKMWKKLSGILKGMALANALNWGIVEGKLKSVFVREKMATGQGSKNLEEDEEDDKVADMEMCTSPASSRSATPLPNLAAHPSPMVPWFVSPDMGHTGAFGVLTLADPSAAMYMLGHLSQQYGYLSGGGQSGECSTSSLGFPRQKETIRLKNAVMYPPNPNAPVPQLRNRPLGCRTVFVGGLPEKCTEEIVRELLERCGEIQSIRMSKKNFAHVRFVNHDCVDRALYFSGYRMKVEDRSDKEFTGRVHLDYAQARDDMHEWEMEKRGLERERERSSSPGSSSHFSEAEAAALLEKLKDSDTFTEASQQLLNWLDKGECQKKTSTVFYSMVAAVNAHVRRLVHDRRQYETELREFREKHNQRLQGVLTQFFQIEKVFRLARKQKNWDHFSRAQRKNVDGWLKHAETIRKANEEAMLRDRYEEEMETSDDEEQESSKDDRCTEESFLPVHKKFKADQDDVAQRRIDENVINENSKLKVELQELRKLKDLADSDGKGPESKTLIDQAPSTSNQECVFNSEMESRFVALLACFLNVHPFGASADYMWAYLRQTTASVRVADIENTLERYPHLFRLQASGVGATYERKWMFIGFQG